MELGTGYVPPLITVHHLLANVPLGQGASAKFLLNETGSSPGFKSIKYSIIGYDSSGRIMPLMRPNLVLGVWIWVV